MELNNAPSLLQTCRFISCCVSRKETRLQKTRFISEERVWRLRQKIALDWLKSVCELYNCMGDLCPTTNKIVTSTVKLHSKCKANGIQNYRVLVWFQCCCHGEWVNNHSVQCESGRQILLTSGPSMAAGSVMVIMTSLTSSMGMSPITLIRLASSRVSASGSFRFSPNREREKQREGEKINDGLGENLVEMFSGRDVLSILRLVCNIYRLNEIKKHCH